MRPTYLEFRSPKEKTPDAYNPTVTPYGKKLGFSTSRISGSFAQGKRFQQYEIDAKRTGFRIGPGSYDSPKLEIIKPKKGVHVYKAYHGSKDIGNNGYFFSGNHLVFEPSYVLPSRKTSVVNEICVEKPQSRPISAKLTETKSTGFSNTPTRKRPASAAQRTLSPYNSKLKE